MSTIYQLSLSSTSDKDSEKHTLLFGTQGGAKRKASKIVKTLTSDHGFDVSGAFEDSVDLSSGGGRVKLVVAPQTLN